MVDSQEERGIIRDASGRPRGVLIEAAMEIMERAVDRQIPEAAKLAMLEVATRYLNSFGITSVVNATGSLAELRLYAILRDRGLLNVRTRTGGVYVPEERITVDEAVRAYTMGSAYAAFFDDLVGTLEVGKQADLVVLSQDLFTVPHEQIAATRAAMTMVGGRVVYQQEP